jgi:hypothetical protein
MFSQKGKCIKIIKGFKFSFQKKLAFSKELWYRTTKLCWAFLKINEHDKV